jgi:aspartate racemase
MKTIGIIGGMSWESSLEYYRIINQLVQQRLGKPHSAKIVMLSVDFAEIELLQRQDRWDEATQAMIDAARQVQAGGADFLLIATNTMHKMAPEVQAAIDIPLLHIADAAAEAIKTRGLQTVGLLGTRFTMEGAFYKDRLEQMHGLRVLIPSAPERELVHRVIYDELVVGVINPASRRAYQEVIANLTASGAQGVILGCTEIGLLIKTEDTPAPLFDTTQIHAEAAVAAALR